MLFRSAAHEDLINSDTHLKYDLLVLQEPFVDSYGNTKATRHWWVVYPTLHLLDLEPSRVVILVSTKLDTNAWSQMHIPGTRDLAAI